MIAVNVITGKTKLAGVMGWPVSHTMSPPMQNAGIASAGIDAVFVPLAVRPERLEEGIKGLRGLGFVGVNVTIPHKEAVVPFLDELTDAARIVGAVNCIKVEEDGRLVGHNTDCEGAVRALEADGTDLRGKAVAIIGAGGAGRGAAVGCAMAGCSRIVMLNRTVDRARRVVEELSGLREFSSTKWEFSPLDQGCAWPEIDVVLQMSSLGMNGQGTVPWDAKAVPGHCHVLDAVYHPLETSFLAAARARGLRCTDGLAMLLEQGISAFEFWFGVEPDRHVMREALASAFQDGKSQDE